MKTDIMRKTGHSTQFMCAANLRCVSVFPGLSLRACDVRMLMGKKKVSRIHANLLKDIDVIGSHILLCYDDLLCATDDEVTTLPMKISSKAFFFL